MMVTTPMGMTIRDDGAMVKRRIKGLLATGACETFLSGGNFTSFSGIWVRNLLASPIPRFGRAAAFAQPLP